MRKSTLIVVTGRPGSGKTTLAHVLAKELQLPLVSRDELKEGFMWTGAAATMSHDEIAKQVYEWFFSGIAQMLQDEGSVIVEAAFQHHVWSPKLEDLSELADIRLVLCEVSPALAFSRMQQRYQEEPGRREYHPLPAGHKGVDEVYNPPRIDAPGVSVDTSDGYHPSLGAILEFLGSGQPT